MVVIILPRCHSANGVSVQTKYKFKDFIKAVEICAAKRFGSYNIISKPGSARRIELFKDKKDSIPSEMFVVHEDKNIWSDDLKKAALHLKMTKEELEEVIKSL